MLKLYNSLSKSLKVPYSVIKQWRKNIFISINIGIIINIIYENMKYLIIYYRNTFL